MTLLCWLAGLLFVGLAWGLDRLWGGYYQGALFLGGACFVLGAVAPELVLCRTSASRQS